jgi:signal transduction histidine kinase/CheY-like chemotaxis protein
LNWTRFVNRLLDLGVEMAKAVGMRQYLWLFVLLLLVFFTTRMGGVFTLSPDSPALFWPPNAVLLAGLFLLNPKIRPTCLVLSIPMYLAAELWSGYPAAAALGFSIANCLGVTIAFFIITRTTNAPHHFTSFNNLLAMASAFVGAAIVSGLIGAFTISYLGGSFFPAWLGWVLADLIAFLVLTPLILTLNEWPKWFRTNPFGHIAISLSPICALAAILVAVQEFAFPDLLPHPGTGIIAAVLVYFTAVQLGAKGVSIALILFTLIVFSLNINGHGITSVVEAAYSSVVIQSVIALIGLSSSALAVLIHERDAAYAKLFATNENLETLVEDGSRELVLRTEQLAMAKKMEAVGRLTGGVAHDFNNLLAVIQGNVELFELADYSDDEIEELAAIKKAVSSGATLTHRLLAYSRKSIMALHSVNIAELIAQRVSIFSRLLGETIDFTYEADPATWPVMVDPHRLEDALLNLVVNARDAMSMGGTLHITTENTKIDSETAKQFGEVSEGFFVLVTVTDTGCGIPPDLMDKVFDPFFTTKQFGSGSGLGLSMVYGFAKQTKGHVLIESAPDESTSVKLYIPRAEAISLVETPQKNGMMPSRYAGHRILVVEDNAEVLNICERVLRIQGFEVVSAMNGREAMKLLSDQAPFDLLFSDIILPGDMSGFDILREAQILQPHMKFLLTTGYTELSGLDEQSINAGAQILYKPYTLEKMLELVEATMAQK